MAETSPWRRRIGYYVGDLGNQGGGKFVLYTGELKAHRQWTLPAVATALNRLVEKGFLTCEKEGRSNYYRARISEEDYKAAEGRTFLEKLYGNSFTGMVASLYDSRAIGPEDLEDLRRFLDELEGK